MGGGLENKKDIKSRNCNIRRQEIKILSSPNFLNNLIFFFILQLSSPTSITFGAKLNTAINIIIDVTVRRIEKLATVVCFQKREIKTKSAMSKSTVNCV